MRPSRACAHTHSVDTPSRIAVSVHVAPRPTQVTLTRPVFGHASRTRALADLRAGRLQGGGSGPITVGVTETVTHDGLVVCRSTRTETLTATYATTTHHGELVTIAGPDLGLSFFNTSDVLRTDCPGPADEDDLAASHPHLFSENPEAVAQGVVPMRAFVGTRTTVGISRDGTFAAHAYAGQWSGTLRFALRRAGLTVRIRHGGYHEPAIDQLP